ncbi:DUF4097 family beta strand repeat protein, partial [bacterium]|nr:DUF4097 family beta strand repeat protein [bacterium]
MKIFKLFLPIILFLMLIACKLEFGDINFQRLDKNAKKYSKIVEKEFALGETSTLSIKSVSGDIKFLPSTNGLLRIKGEICCNEKKDHLNDVKMRIDQNTNSVTIKTESNKKIAHAWINYTIFIPKNCKLENIKTVTGDISIEAFIDPSEKDKEKGIVLNLRKGRNDLNDILGKATNISSSSGDIKLLNFIGNQIIKTVTGDINIKDNFGNIYISTSSGDIEILDSIGVLDTKTVTGDIKANGRLTIKGIQTSSGDMTLKNVNFINEANLKSVSGDMTLFIGNDKDLLIDFKSVSGDLNTGKMSLNIQINKKRNIIKFGNGKKHLHINTVSG